MQTVEIMEDDGFKSIQECLREKIEKGYSIVSVCPILYDIYSNGQFIKRAVVILEEEKE